MDIGDMEIWNPDGIGMYRWWKWDMKIWGIYERVVDITGIKCCGEQDAECERVKGGEEKLVPVFRINVGSWMYDECRGNWMYL